MNRTHRATRRALTRRLAALMAAPHLGVPARATPRASAPTGALLRVASAFDPQTLDPHALALLYHSRVALQVYEALVGRDAHFRIEPALALSWQMTAPTRWRLQLRAGVSFHDGTPFTADDAVFSLERALAPPSQRAQQLAGVHAVRKVAALEIEIQLDAPDAVLPEKLVAVGMMSKAWCERHGVARAQDVNARQDTYAVRRANGTGPMRLDHHEPDVRTRLARHTAWWGWPDARSGNLAQVHFVVMKSDAARLAALAAGEVDLLLDPPHAAVARLKADARIALAQTAGLGQQMLAFDHSRNELHDADVLGRNPFKDVRVRRAVVLALNVPLIIDKVLHGQAVPTGAFISPLVDGSPAELDRRPPYDPARARLLLGEAGYPNGFAVTLDCLSVPWREAACQAVATMLTQVGVRTTLRTSSSNAFFPRLSLGAVSFAEFGWTPTADAWNTLNSLFRSPEGNGLGSFNAGRYRNPKIDALIDAIRAEPILRRRRALISTVLRLLADDLPVVPLYRPTVTWAMARRVTAVQWPDDTLELRWVKVA